MKYQTVRFGTIEVEENEIINFPEGIPGFQGLTKFVMLDLDTYKPFGFLQSLEEPNLTFILINPYDHFQGYPNAEEIRKGFSVTDLPFVEGQWLIKTIVTINSKMITANLLAPIVIHRETKIGEQVILTAFTGLHTKHPIVPLKSASEEAY